MHKLVCFICALSIFPTAFSQTSKGGVNGGEIALYNPVSGNYSYSITITAGQVPDRIINMEYAYDPCEFGGTFIDNNYSIYYYSWSQSIDGANWTGIGPSGAYGPTYQPPALNQTTYYRREAVSISPDPTPGCVRPTYSSFYSNVVVVKVLSPTSMYGGFISADRSTVCYNGSVTFSNTADAAGGTAPLTYQWEEQTGSGSYTPIANANATTYTTPGLTVTKSFRRKVTDANGLVYYSNPLTISQIPGAVATITNGTTVSANCSVTLNAATASGNTYQWQLKDNNNVYQNIAGAINSSYTAALSGSYKVVVTNTSSCGTTVATSNPITATVTTFNAVATITNGAAVTGTCNVTLTAATATGNTYQWQMKDGNNVFQNIAGATSSTYTALQSGYYKVVVTNNNCSSSAATSAATSVTIDSPPAVANITNGASATDYCAVYLNATTAVNYRFQWQVLDNNNVYQDIANATNGLYIARQSGVYRLQVTNNVCNSAPSISSPTTVTLINPPAVATITNGSTASGNCSVQLNAVNAPGYTFQWQLMDNNGVYQDIINARAYFYIATQSGAYRVVVNSPFCYSGVFATSDPVNVTIVPNAATISNGAAVSGNCNITLAANTASGNSYQWLLKDNNNVYQNIPGATASTYVVTISGSYKVSIASSSCGGGSAISAATVVTIISAPPSATILNGATASGSCSVTLAAGATSGNSYQWLLKDNNNVYQNIAGATASTYNTSVSGSYKVNVTNTACNSTTSTSDATAVTITNAAPGNPSIFGDNNWIFYAYNGVNDNLASNAYRGYYEYAVNAFANFYEPNEYNRSQSPSYLPAVPFNSSPWYGCSVDVDYFTLVAKRKGFPCGNYRLQIRVGQNESYQVYLNGTLIGSGSNPTSSTSFVSLNTTALNSTSTIEVRTKHNTGDLRSDFEVVQLDIALTAGSILPGSQTVNYNTVPTALTSYINGTSTVNTLVYQWESAPSNVGPWTPIANANAATYIPPALLQATYFRRSATNGTCEGPKYSNTALVTVTNIPVTVPLVAGSIAAISNSTCTGGNTGINDATAASGGNGALTYAWEQKIGTGAFTSIAGANLASLSVTNLSATTTFRRKVTDGAGTSAYSNEVSISVFIGGTISPATQTIGSGSVPSQLVSTALATGNTSPVTYQWQVSAAANGTWSGINGETNSSYQPASLVQTAYYRRAAFTSTCTAGAVSNVAEIIVTAAPATPLEAGTIAAVTSQCVMENTAPSLLNASAATGGTAPYTYQWQLNDNGNWTDIASANGQHYQPSPIAVATSFRRKVTDNAGSIAYSNTVSFTIQYTTLKAGIIDGAQVTCSNTAPGIIENIIDACGGGGNLQYTWEISTANGSWTTIANANAPTYNAVAIAADTKYRRRVADGCSNGAYSNTVQVLVYPAIEAGTVAPLSQTLCNTVTPEKLSLLQDCHYTNGTVSFQWQYATSLAGPWTDIANSAGRTSFFQPRALSVTTYYRLMVTSTVCGAVSYSNIVVINISNCAQVEQGRNQASIAPSTLSTRGNLKVYPNPAGQGQTISLIVDGGDGTYKAALKSTDGRTYNCTVTSSGKGQLQLKLPQPIARGTYLIQLSNNKQQWIERIVVQ